MVKKYLITSVLIAMLIVVCIILGACAQSPDEVKTNNDNKESLTESEEKSDSVNNPGGSAVWEKSYDDIDSLIKGSDLIIKGTVQKSVPEKRNTLVFTMQEIKTDKLILGETDDDIIKILQTGGELDELKTSPISEAPLLEEGKSYILFLYKTEEGHYLIPGGSQGVGLVEEDTLKPIYAGNAISEFLEGKTIDFMESHIKQVLES